MYNSSVQQQQHQHQQQHLDSIHHDQICERKVVSAWLVEQCRLPLSTRPHNSSLPAATTTKTTRAETRRRKQDTARTQQNNKLNWLAGRKLGVRHCRRSNRMRMRMKAAKE